MERKDSEDKVSPALRIRGAELVFDDPGVRNTIVFLAEFRPGTGPGEMRAAATFQGLLIREHPDLALPHLLLEGTLDQLEALARREETSYLWPASDDLVRGNPVRGCGGSIGQAILRIGQGWDGAGKGAVELGWTLSRYPSRVPADEALQAVEAALAEWSRWVRVDFRQSGNPSAARHLNLLFAGGAHGDPFPFDGRGRTLAHTFYPAPVNAEPVAGDMHFDDDENWQIGTDTDIYSVVLHELGHALGLGHSDTPGAVMYPYYRRAEKLSEEDIREIQGMYAARTAGTDPPPAPAPAPTPTPNPPPTVPSAPPPAGTPDRVAPTVTISSPAQTAVVVTAESVTLRGTAKDNQGVSLVTWWSNTAGVGVAAGTTEWSVASLPLMKGTNYIKITAFDASGNASWKSVVITRR